MSWFSYVDDLFPVGWPPDDGVFICDISRWRRDVSVMTPDDGVLSLWWLQITADSSWRRFVFMMTPNDLMLSLWWLQITSCCLCVTPYHSILSLITPDDGMLFMRGLQMTASFCCDDSRWLQVVCVMCNDYRLRCVASVMTPDDGGKGGGILFVMTPDDGRLSLWWWLQMTAYLSLCWLLILPPMDY